MRTPVDPGDPIQSAFAAEVPEFADGTVEIKRLAREPGNRAIVAVTSNDSALDPVLACAGERGERLYRIVQDRMAGENVDLVRWSEDPKRFIKVILGVHHVQSISLCHEDNVATVVLDQDGMKIIHSRSEVHMRLAEELSGWKLNVETNTDKED